MRCAVKGCNTKTYLKAIGGGGISFFSFPKPTEADRLRKWVNFCNREGFEPTQHHRMCCLHFSSEQLQRDPVKLAKLGYPNARMKLKADAVPDTQLGFHQPYTDQSEFLESMEIKVVNSESSEKMSCIIPCEDIKKEYEEDDTLCNQSNGIINHNYLTDSSPEDEQESCDPKIKIADCADKDMTPHPVCLVRNIRSVCVGQEMGSDCNYVDTVKRFDDTVFSPELRCELVQTERQVGFSQRRNGIVNTTAAADVRLVSVKMEEENDESDLGQLLSKELHFINNKESNDESFLVIENCVQTTGPRRQYHCPMCPAISDNFDILKSHIFAEHPEMGCLSRIRSLSDTDRYERLSNALESLKESTLVRPRSENAIVDEMLREKSIYMDGDLFCCTSCTKQFKLLTNLLSHRCRHAPLKKRRIEKADCPVCNKTFTQRHSLKLHMRIHTGEKPYKCHVCEKPFRHNHGLALHMRIHTGEKPHRCVICGKSFVDMSNLRAHLRSAHTKEKPFKCELCEKAFNDKPRLAFHQRTHSDERPDKCRVCDSSFRWPSQLKKHMKQCHPTQTC